MRSIDYWDAWSVWWSGQSVSGMQMWGWPLLYWGRFGKILQFTGGLVVVLDIIGPNRLERLGRRYLISSKRLITAPSGERIRQVGDDSVPLEKQVLTTVEAFVFLSSRVLTALLWLGLGVLAFIIIKSIQYNPVIIAVVVVASVVAIFLGRLLLPMVSLTISVGLLALTSVIMLGLAKVTRFGEDNHPARWVAFFLVCVGFHFDLLAS